jgi:dephospho-CoA kinase
MTYKYAIAITGGIAVGKSTTKSLLYLYGYYCIDADDISHKLLDKNYKIIADIFGSNFVDHKKQKTHRKKLGELVFNNKEKLNLLQDFIHPKIQEEIQRLALKQEEKKFPYFIDIPLFYEKKSYDINNVLVVYTPKNVQIQRLVKRDNISNEEALKKINLQIDIEIKKNFANFIIDNSKTLKHLQDECLIFMENIKDFSKFIT